MIIVVVRGLESHQRDEKNKCEGEHSTDKINLKYFFSKECLRNSLVFAIYFDFSKNNRFWDRRLRPDNLQATHLYMIYYTYCCEMISYNSAYQIMKIN